MYCCFFSEKGSRRQQYALLFPMHNDETNNNIMNKKHMTGKQQISWPSNLWFLLLMSQVWPQDSMGQVVKSIKVLQSQKFRKKDM